MAKKMLLVDPRWVETMHQASPLPDPMGQSLRNLDSQMRDILERADMNMNDKAHLYQKTLQRFLNRANQYRGKPLGMVDVKPPETETTPPTPAASRELEKEVLQSVPSIFKKKAERLLHHLKQNPELSWNDRGEISVQGQTIKHSNIIDLVNDVLRQRKNISQPTGWEMFATALSQTNVPQDLIGHPDRWKYIRGQIQSSEAPKKPQKVKADTTFTLKTKSHKRKKVQETLWEEL